MGNNWNKKYEIYHDLYLTFDVFLLTNVFENVRFESIDCFELGLAHCLSCPSYSCHAILRFTVVNLITMNNFQTLINVISSRVWWKEVF